jgi:DNA-binding MarR family transcriptional regulator
MTDGTGFDMTDLDAEREIGPDDDLPALPRRRSRAGRGRPAFTSIHAACHQLGRRLERLLADAGAYLSATEAVVLLAITTEPGAAIAISRRETGVHPSTMTSVLDRLERHGLIRRERSNDDHRFVGVWPTLTGNIAGDQARAALRELDEELGVHVHVDDLAGLDDLAAAAAAIAPRGTLPDY